MRTATHARMISALGLSQASFLALAFFLDSSEFRLLASCIAAHSKQFQCAGFDMYGDMHAQTDPRTMNFDFAPV